MLRKNANIRTENRSVVARDWRLGEKLTTKGIRECFGVIEYYSISWLWWLRNYIHLSELCIKGVNFTVCITYIKINEGGQTLDLLQEALQNKLMALPTKDSKYPSTRYYYLYMIKLNASVAYGLMATSHIFILHLMSENIQGKSLFLSAFCDLGQI